jgi:serine acetyltransferase
MNVGAGAKILGNVVISDDACVGANAVVLTDVGAGETAIGIPAKILTQKAAPGIAPTSNDVLSLEVAI